MLDLSVENNALVAPVDVGGQTALSFTSRKVHTFLRLREGEANLLAGLINQENTTARTGVLGLSRIPGLRNLFGRNEITDTDTDIVMLITPHIVRDHQLTREDVAAVYIGTQANVGLSGPPQLIAPQPEAPPPAGGTAPPTQPTTGQTNPAPAAFPRRRLALPVACRPRIHRFRRVRRRYLADSAAGASPVPGGVPPTGQPPVPALCHRPVNRPSCRPCPTPAIPPVTGTPAPGTTPPARDVRLRSGRPPARRTRRPPRRSS